MPKSLPPHPNVRNCTHIKVTGQRCGSPALRREFFCYFHTRVIKGVQQRVDMQLHSMALLEDCESIQLSIMHVVDGLIKGTLDPTRARLIIQALRIAARNAKNVRFDDVHYRASEQPMVREAPDYARQYLIEHPNSTPQSNPVARAPPPARPRQQPSSEKPKPSHEPQSKTPRREAQRQTQPRSGENAAHGASRGTEPENNPAPKERKNPRDPSSDKVGNSKEYERIQPAEAAIPSAMAGNWRDLRAVFEFAGISEPNKEAPVTREHDR